MWVRPLGVAPSSHFRESLDGNAMILLKMRTGKSAECQMRERKGQKE